MSLHLLFLWLKQAGKPGLLVFALVFKAAASEPLSIIRDNCLRCHSEEKRKGGLVLATRQKALKGGESGIVLVPGNPGDSLLIKVLQPKADPHMPPKKQLKEDEIEILRQWIVDGLKWDAAILKEVPRLEPVEFGALPALHQPSNAIAVSPDGSTFAFPRGNRIEIHSLEENTTTILHTLEGHRISVQSLAWSNDGRILASGGFRRAILWNVETGKQEHVLEKDLAGRITAIAFANDGQRLIIADSLPTRIGRLHAYRTQGWSRVKVVRAHTDSILALATSPIGQLIASTGADKLARIWDANTLQPVGILEGHTGYALSAAFSPDGKRIATTSADHTVKVWNVQSHNEEITFSARKSGHDITGIIWLLDPAKQNPGEKDNWIVTVSSDGIPRLFNQLVNHEGKQTSTGAREKAWPGIEKHGLTALAWSSSHKRILLADEVGNLHFRDIHGKPWKPASAEPEKNSQPSTRPGTNSKGIDFRNDILPILSRAGCADGSCHAKSGGQNGFQLSIFAFDPMADHRSIALAAQGRRTFPAAPGQSLILQKATESIDHEGGLRFKKDSAFYRTLYQWISQGMPFTSAEEPSLTSISVDPAEGKYARNTRLSLNVTAHYSDDTTRDVTRLSHYQSNDDTIASIDEDGQVATGDHSGEGVLIIRYMDKVEVVRINIPPDSILPDSDYSSLPIHNEIDRLNYARHKELGLLISDKCSDSEFLRRATLDATGKLPGSRVASRFLADKSPDKRNKLIDQLLSDPDWADYWAIRLGDLLRPNTKRVGVKPVYLLDHWIRRKLRTNPKWDEFVGELLTATGSSHQYGPVAFFRDKREPASAGASVSRIFLGVRLECAQCHHHPNEKWSQDDYYQLASFFGSMKRKGQGISAPISGEPEYWWFQPGGTVRHPVTDEVMSFRPPEGPVLEVPKDIDPRRALVNWMLEKDNPFFAKAIVNRVWGEFFGVGIVHPVDDFRASNPPTNGPLLDWLAMDFVSHGYDLKHLMQRILKSRTYQTSSLPNKTNAGDHQNFTRSIRRRLSAEVMADAVASVTGIAADYEGLPPLSRAMRVWNTSTPSTFLDTFGRPDSSAECPCERDTAPTITQTLHLANNSKLLKRITLKASRASVLAGSDHAPEHIVDELYLSAFARHPTKNELKVAVSTFDIKDATRQTAVEDILWALLNSAEFVLKH